MKAIAFSIGHPSPALTLFGSPTPFNRAPERAGLLAPTRPLQPRTKSITRGARHKSHEALARSSIETTEVTQIPRLPASLVRKREVRRPPAADTYPRPWRASCVSARYDSPYRHRTRAARQTPASRVVQKTPELRTRLMERDRVPIRLFDRSTFIPVRPPAN